jgi:hypothetical protein
MPRQTIEARPWVQTRGKTEMRLIEFPAQLRGLDVRWQWHRRGLSVDGLRFESLENRKFLPAEQPTRAAHQ